MRRPILPKIIVLLLAMAIASPSVAQTKRKTTTRRTTTTAKKTTTAVKKTSGKYTMYNFQQNGKLHLAFTQDYLYFVEADYSYGNRTTGNAVRRISKVTGEISTVISPRKRLYEGEERPFIQRAYVYCDHLLLQTPKKLYSVPISNTSFSNWKEVANLYSLTNANKIAVSADGRYCVVLVKTTEGPKLRIYCDGKLVKERKHRCDGDPYEAVAGISNAGTVFIDKVTESNPGYCIPLTANKGYSYLGWCTEFHQQQNNNEADWDANNFNLLNVTTNTLDGNIYVSYHRRIYKRDPSFTGQWEEYACLSPEEAGHFGCFTINNNGDVLMVSDGGNFILLKKGHNVPTRIGRVINTDLEQGGWISRYVSWTATPYELMYSDLKGNFLLVDDSNIFIYNPDGIIGYTQTKGKYIKVQ